MKTGNLDKWTRSTIITMYNNYFKPMDNGSMSNYSPRRGGLLRDGWQSVADGGKCAPAGEAAGRDNGAEVGVDLGPPFRAKPVRHSAEDHRGWQRPLALVTGRLDVAARQEHQQLVARRHDNGRPQVAALDIGRLEVQQAIQLAVKAAPMRCDRAVGEIGPPVPDGAGILQERLELRCEDRVAVIDRVLRITDQRRGRTGAPRRVCTAPAGDPTATPSAARQRESPSARTCRASARSHDRRRWRSRTPIASASCPSRARWSRRWRSPRWRARWRRSAVLPRRTACPCVPACWRSRPGRLSGRTGLRTVRSDA